MDALDAEGTLVEFVPLDVSETALRGAVLALHTEYPTLAIHGVVADFTEHLGRIPGQAPRMVAFLGGTIGNLLPEERATFLRELRDTLAPGEWLLLGTDLVKDPDVLVPAYDDAAGVTAAFNRNALTVLNRELGGNFDVESYEHVAIWDAENEWIEMRLRSTAAAQVTLSELALEIAFEPGEEILTEISAKFRRPRIEGGGRPPPPLPPLLGPPPQKPSPLPPPPPQRTHHPTNQINKPHNQQTNTQTDFSLRVLGLFHDVCPAASYSPTPSPVQYHRR